MIIQSDLILYMRKTESPKSSTHSDTKTEMIVTNIVTPSDDTIRKNYVLNVSNEVENFDNIGLYNQMLMVEDKVSEELYLLWNKYMQVNYCYYTINNFEQGQVYLTQMLSLMKNFGYENCKYLMMSCINFCEGIEFKQVKMKKNNSYLNTMYI